MDSKLKAGIQKIPGSSFFMPYLEAFYHDLFDTQGYLDFVNLKISKRPWELLRSKLVIGKVPYRLKDNSYLRKSKSGKLIVLIPVELLFSYDAQQTIEKYKRLSDEYKETLLKWADLPLFKLEPHFSLYQFFMTGEIKPDVYIDWQQKVNGEALQQRYHEFLYMQKQLSMNGLEFFMRHPVQATWNNRGYFNLTDGHHQAMFLLTQMLRYIPVEISKDDYKIWRNDINALLVKRFWQDNENLQMYTPVLNPFFFDNYARRDDKVQSRLYHLSRFFRDQRMTNKKVLDMEGNMGYIGQHFYREGAKVTILETDPKYCQGIKMMDKLLYTKCSVKKCALIDFADKEKYNIGLLLNAFENISDNKQKKKVLSGLNKYVTDCLVWESSADTQKERDFILKNSRFKTYTHLTYTYTNDKVGELGVFT